MIKKIYLLIILFVCCVSVSFAAYVVKLPVTLTQPDGSVISCFASGDEFYNWLHDDNGYVIISNQEGYYCYAVLQNNNIVASQYRVNTVNPAAVGLTPNISISAEAKIARKNAMWKDVPDKTSIKEYREPKSPKNVGVMNNLVVYIRFADQTDFPEDTTHYWNMFDKNDDNTYQSLLNYFYQASYHQLSIVSSFYPLTETTTILSYQDEHPRQYYMPYDAVNAPLGYNENGNQRAEREFKLLKDATEYIAGMVPTDLNLDYNDDGLVDNVVFVVRGAPTAWATLLWPHRWVLYGEQVYINGKQVYDFNFQLETHLNDSEASVLCHEMFHSLGSPDLYRYSDNTITPIGSWDVMSGNTNPAQTMAAYMKYKYGGWLNSIPEITEGGVYTLHTPWSQENCFYKIASPNSNGEFFLLEYRNKLHTFDSKLPGEGLLIYRVFPSVNGNADGPPDELYVFRPGGVNTTTNGDVDNAYFSMNSGRTEFNDTTDPPCFLINNQPGGIYIRNVGEAGGPTISFEVVLNTAPEADFTASQEVVTTNCEVDFTATSFYVVDEWFWEFEDGVPATSTEQNPAGVVFSQPGLKTVKLTVTNTHGSNTEVKEGFINVSNNLAPQADFYVFSTSVCIGAEIQLFDNSSICPNAWEWSVQPNTFEFAEGYSASSQNPIIRLTQPDEYTVTLNVSNSNGTSAVTKENYLTTVGLSPITFVLDFNDASNFEELGVIVDNPDGDKTWELIDIDGDGAAYINLFKYTHITERDYFTLPLLNLDDNYMMSFRHAFCLGRNSYSDSLCISISVDCGNTWDRLATYFEDGSYSFATREHLYTNFIPSNNDEWCGTQAPCNVVDLSYYKGSQSALIRFESVKITGNNLFIDDIHFEAFVGIDDFEDEDNGNVVVYPNPSNGSFNVKIAGNSGEQYTVSVFDLVGKLLKTNTYSSEIANIDLSDKAKGVYFVVVNAKNSNKKIKIVNL